MDGLPQPVPCSQASAAAGDERAMCAARAPQARMQHSFMTAPSLREVALLSEKENALLPPGQAKRVHQPNLDDDVLDAGHLSVPLDRSDYPHYTPWLMFNKGRNAVQIRPHYFARTKGDFRTMTSWDMLYLREYPDPAQGSRHFDMRIPVAALEELYHAVGLLRNFPR